MRRAFAISLFLIISGCGLPAEPEPGEAAPLESVRFEGLILAGTPVQARASGFTDCTPEGNGYYGFTCTNHDATILGVRPLRTIVRLEYPSDLPYDAERKPEATTYRGVEFQFSKPLYETVEGCDYDPTNPYKCYADQSAGLPRLITALETNGWLGESRRSGSSFVKPGVPFTVYTSTREVYQEMAGERHLVVQVSVYPTDLDEVRAMLERLRANERAVQARTDATANFVENMKEH